MTISQVIFALGAMTVLLSPISGFASDSTPALATIIQQAIARDAANQKALQSMEYHQFLRTERVDENDNVTQKEELQMIVRPGAAQEIQVLSAKGDALPTNPDEASLQAQGKKAQNQQVDISLKALAGRFKISFVRKDILQGQPVYIIAFEPKPDQAYRNQTEKVLNHLRGHMWIRAQDYTVLKTEASLAEPVEIAWIFAQVSALTFHYELNNTSGGMGPAQMLTLVKVSAPFISITQRITMDLTQFQQRSKT